MSGGFTKSAVFIVSPDFTNSFTPFSYSVLESDTCCTISKFTLPITTSGTSFTFSSVCFMVLPRAFLNGENIKIGGLVLNILKKLNGETFTFPSLSTVEANAIGLGATECCKTLCSSKGVIFLGNICFHF